MAKNRIDRINEEILHALPAILRTVKDPRVQNAGMISVTHVDTAGDLSQCKVYLSVFAPGVELNKKEFTQGLKSCSGYIRKELAAQVKLRVAPEILFILDDSLDRGAKIIQLIQTTLESDQEKGNDL